MFMVKRNQIVISALVIMIGVAGYLNYIDAGKGNATPIALNDNGDVVALVPDLNSSTVATVSKDVATTNDNPSIAVSGDNVANSKTVATTKTAASTTASKVADKSPTPGEAVFVNASTDSSYFVQAKLDREQARAKEKDILMGVVNSDTVAADKKSLAADEVLQIQKRIEKETAAEAMIESKGFNGVYVRIDDNTVDVVVNKTDLTDAEIAQIQDIVTRKTGLAADKIKINVIKNNK